MKTPGTGIGSLVIATLVLALSGSASAAPIVPPENSAATQYTEAFPTAGGPKATGRPEGKPRTPAGVLGARKAHRLEAHGEQGRTIAQVVAQTAPISLESAPRGIEGKPRTSRSQGGPRANDNLHGGPARTVEEVGSSGLREALSQATGSSGTGGMGLLLPLVILGALVWAGAYWARQRRQQTT